MRTTTHVAITGGLLLASAALYFFPVADWRPKTVEDWGDRPIHVDLTFEPGSSGTVLIVRVRNTSRQPVIVSRIAELQVGPLSEHRTTAFADDGEDRTPDWFILPRGSRQIRLDLGTMSFRSIHGGVDRPALDFVREIPDWDREFSVHVSCHPALFGDAVIVSAYLEPPRNAVPEHGSGQPPSPSSPPTR